MRSVPQGTGKMGPTKAPTYRGFFAPRKGHHAQNTGKALRKLLGRSHPSLHTRHQISGQEVVRCQGHLPWLRSIPAKPGRWSDTHAPKSRASKAAGASRDLQKISRQVSRGFPCVGNRSRGTSNCNFQHEPKNNRALHQCKN